MSTNTPEIEAARAVAREQVESWGTREAYPISFEEAATLVRGGGTFQIHNFNNEDGTYFNVLSFEGKTFKLSSKERL